MSKKNSTSLYLYVEKLKIGGLKYDRLSPIETDLFKELHKEHIKERKNELIQLENIKNSVRQQIVEKQKDKTTQYIDFSELELICLGNKNTTNVLSTQIINYLFWLTYRHHAPMKPYNFLVILIMVLMIIEVVIAIAYPGLPRDAVLPRYWLRT